jgi:hypothetical protein
MIINKKNIISTLFLWQQGEGHHASELIKINEQEET